MLASKRLLLIAESNLLWVTMACWKQEPVEKDFDEYHRKHTFNETVG